jgi:hypothetical protein
MGSVLPLGTYKERDKDDSKKCSPVPALRGSVANNNLRREDGLGYSG